MLQKCGEHREIRGVSAAKIERSFGAFEFGEAFLERSKRWPLSSQKPGPGRPASFEFHALRHSSFQIAVGGKSQVVVRGKVDSLRTPQVSRQSREFDLRKPVAN